MDKNDFALFYNSQSDYEEFRNDPAKREYYSIIADWKVRKLIQLLPPGFIADNILEVGCAFGVLLNNIADRLHLESRTGVDISSKNIDVAKSLYPKCNFFLGTFEEFSKFNSDKNRRIHYDIIVLSDIVEHIPDDLEFLRIANKSCTYVLLNLPLEKSFITRNRKYGEDDHSGHLRSYDEKDAVQLVKRARFEIINSFTEIAFSDKEVYAVSIKNRRLRVRAKSLLRRIFWSVFYSIEDVLKLINKRLSERIFGTNYFALLKSNNNYEGQS